MNFFFPVYLISKWEETLENFHFLIFGAKRCFYLTYLAREYFEKLAFKGKTANATLKGCIPKARANSESKLRLLQSSFNFLQNKVLLPADRRVRRVNYEPVKYLHIPFFVNFIRK